MWLHWIIGRFYIFLSAALRVLCASAVIFESLARAQLNKELKFHRRDAESAEGRREKNLPFMQQPYRYIVTSLYR